ncbi:Rieske 2Fe-2S domain-containing protein [Acidianus sulfidivorans JP7]|uniref:Rieske (2Fe-2S) protein n=1 Tax=Acidianus sulfidivorans JP7 TaxID=619593 RepID=A0A2U9IJW3_9CREN|nr:Rieske 2Fe-2S domain-containing protein [Acidianus sulfidivorans]AWR96313.1 Rieske 2Fe-2S domain-containing protein [Acidianus sulfidivorans JP7]
MKDKIIIKRSDFIFAKRLLWKMRNKNTEFDVKQFMSKGRDYLFDYAEKNTGPLDPSRRAFLKGILIGIGVFTVASAIPLVTSLNPQEVSIKKFPWMIIVDSNGNPIQASTLPVNDPTIILFQYPLLGDITFLINMGDENNKPVAIPPTDVVIPQTGKTYHFPGGVGPYNSIVAYSAICQHLGCTPPEIHFYPPQYFKPGGTPPNFLPPDAYSAAIAHNAKSVIHCDCHGSTYDPWHGAAVLTGPTVRPLPYVELYWDSSTDYLYAISMNVNAPPIMDHPSDLVGAAYLDSYDESTGCPKLLLSKNQKPSNCYTQIQNDGDTFGGSS